MSLKKLIQSSILVEQRGNLRIHLEALYEESLEELKKEFPEAVNKWLA